MIIAIDGPSAAGKSTAAKSVAARLGFSCLDTGAMYRALAWQALTDKLPLDDEAALGKLAQTHEISFGHVEGDPLPKQVFISGREVTDVIRTAEVDRAVSAVSAVPAVRTALVAQQQRICRAGNYVVEGRDIGTVVFPDAELKVFLTASAEERARRRVLQNAERGVGSVNYEEVLADIRRRDEYDSTRDTSPLKAADDAICLDSTDFTFEEVIEQICELACGWGAGEAVRVADGSAGGRGQPVGRRSPMRPFLPYEKMWDMPLGGTSQEKQIPHWFGNIAYVVIGAICKICFRYRVDNREALRAFRNKSGLLLVCNHTSFLDVVFMYLVCRPQQWVRLVGRESLFDNAHGLAGQILSRVGAFPIKRDSADRTAIKRASRMLKNRELVGIMPEGTRRGKGSQAPQIHSGAAFIARMGHAPILPMTVRNVEKIKQKGKRLRFPKITIEFGSPILVSDFDFLPKEDRLDACTWYAMRECFALSRRCAPEDVDMRELFPESRDFAEVFATHPIPQRSSEELLIEMEASSQEQDS